MNNISLDKSSLEVGEDIVTGERAALEDTSLVGGIDQPEVCNPAEASLLSKIIRRGLIDSTLDLEM